MRRRLLFDFLCGLAAFAACGAVLLLQNVFEEAFEYTLIAFPVFVFPAVTWFRARRRNSPVSAWAAINVWLLATFGGIAWLAHASPRGFVLPLAIGGLASAFVAVLRRPLAAAAVVACSAAALIAVPAIWNGMLTTSMSVPAS